MGEKAFDGELYRSIASELGAIAVVVAAAAVAGDVFSAVADADTDDVSRKPFAKRSYSGLVGREYRKYSVLFNKSGVFGV